jgi:anti-sigma B factor antagonist
VLRLSHLENKCDVLYVTGELDLATSPELVKAAKDVLTQPSRALVLDIEGVTFMDSTGLSAILTVQRACEACECEFAVCGACPQVQRLFELVGVDRRLPRRTSVYRGGARESYASKRQRFADGMVASYLRQTAV